MDHKRGMWLNVTIKTLPTPDFSEFCRDVSMLISQFQQLMHLSARYNLILDVYTRIPTRIKNLGPERHEALGMIRVPCQPFAGGN